MFEVAACWVLDADLLIIVVSRCSSLLLLLPLCWGSSHGEIFQAIACIKRAVRTVVRSKFLLHQLVYHSDLLHALGVASLSTAADSMSHSLKGRHRIDAVLLLQISQLEHFLGREHNLRLLDRSVREWGELAHGVGDFSVRLGREWLLK